MPEWGTDCVIGTRTNCGINLMVFTTCKKEMYAEAVKSCIDQKKKTPAA